MHWASWLQWIPGSDHVAYAEMALDFESNNNRALQARLGHCHAEGLLSRRERTRMMLEAIDLLQPLLAGGTLLEGKFRWIYASLKIHRTDAPEATSLVLGTPCGL